MQGTSALHTAVLKSIMAKSHVKVYTPKSRLAVVQWKEKTTTRGKKGHWKKVAAPARTQSVHSSPTKSPTKQATDRPDRWLHQDAEDQNFDFAGGDMPPLQLPKSLASA